MNERIKAAVGVLAMVGVVAAVVLFRGRALHCDSVKECVDALPDLGTDRAVYLKGAVEPGDEGTIAETVAQGDVEYQRFLVKDDSGRISVWHHGATVPPAGAKVTLRATVLRVIGPTGPGGDNVKRNVLIFERVEVNQP